MPSQQIQTKRPHHIRREPFPFRNIPRQLRPIHRFRRREILERRHIIKQRQRHERHQPDRDLENPAPATDFELVNNVLEK